MPLQPIPLSSLRKTGLGLVRPEDVVVSRDGRVWASDQQSACAEILADGTLRRVGKAGGAPNGINMDREGNIVTYTTTIENTWGTGITVPGYGFILNNELTDFNFTPTLDASTGNPGANETLWSRLSTS